ncbi:MAG: hypothetical protein NTY45_10305 [Elusimicrobia bacterium]|nr:hypothetical protein [Elusimicrobiota bacterium]
MKKSNMLVAVFAVAIAAGSVTKAQAGTIENLADTSGKISNINMEKDPGEVGKLLDGVYLGIKSKKDMDSPVVYADGKASGATTRAKDICNVEPKKISTLASKVKPLESAPGEPSDHRGEPLGGGLLAAGAAVMGLAGLKKGYFSNYSQDAHTVWDYVTGSDGSSEAQDPCQTHDGCITQGHGSSNDVPNPTEMPNSACHELEDSGIYSDGLCHDYYSRP